MKHIIRFSLTISAILLIVVFCIKTDKPIQTISPFNPTEFNLPKTAKEVITKRTDNTATFELSPGHYAAVSGISQPKEISNSNFLHNLISSAWAATSGPNSPGTTANDSYSGFFAWVDPDNSKTEDAVYATGTNYTWNTDYYSYYLKVTNFGFSIPSGSIINGIIAEVKRKCDTIIYGTNGTATDAVVLVTKGGHNDSTNKGNDVDIIPLSNTFRSFGGESDIWGGTWSASDISSANFGLLYQVNTKGEYGFYGIVSVDFVRITVYYTAAPPAPPVFTAGPSDGGSSITAGDTVTFTATATDAESDNYYLAICKTNAITANNSAPPTCPGDSWCVSTSTVSGAGSTCGSATTSSNVGDNVWYAFVCDHNASSQCSASSQGSGATGSPFTVVSAYVPGVPTSGTSNTYSTTNYPYDPITGTEGPASTPATTTTPTVTETKQIQDLKSKIDLITNLINLFKQQINQKKIAIAETKTSTTNYQFTKDLKYGDIGYSVKNLQLVLNALGLYKSTNISGRFLDNTISAVYKFQDKYKDEILTPNGFKSPTGIVGTATRNKINSLLKGELKSVVDRLFK